MTLQNQVILQLPQMPTKPSLLATSFTTSTRSWKIGQCGLACRGHHRPLNRFKTKFSLTGNGLMELQSTTSATGNLVNRQSLLFQPGRQFLMPKYRGACLWRMRTHKLLIVNPLCRNNNMFSTGEAENCVQMSHGRNVDSVGRVKPGQPGYISAAEQVAKKAGVG